MRTFKNTVVDTMEQARSDFAAARASRFQRRRTGLAANGSGADYHYRHESDWLKLIEYARDMDRNDPIVGSIVDRAVLNTVQGGFILDVNTGDTGLDDAVEARFNAWAGNPEECDIAGEFSFPDFEWFALRSPLVDGDMIAVGTDEGQLQAFEAHRCRNPYKPAGNVIHGVEMDAYRRRLAYYLSDEDIDPSRVNLKGKDFTRIATRDSLGVRRVFHSMTAKRMSQTRGITAFAPMFDLIGMHDDIEYAAALKQQLSACLVFVEEMALGGKLGPGSQFGEQTTTGRADGSSQVTEQTSMAIRVKTPPGGKLTPFNHNTPGDQFFNHVKLLLTLLGVNLGMPLVMVLMDAKETNFSGWRGAVDQARMGFRQNQDRLKKRFHTPVLQWKLSQFAIEDAAMRNSLQKFQRDGVYRIPHDWNAPQWPYIEPLTDRKADALDVANCMVPAREVDGRNGRNFWNKVDKVIEERTEAIRRAKAAAQKINEEFPDDSVPVRWEQIFTFPSADGVTQNYRSDVTPENVIEQRGSSGDGV